MHIEVETQNLDAQVTSLGTAEQFTLVVDRPTEGGGGRLGEVEGDAPEVRLRVPVDKVDEIAEIPNSLRQGTQVRLTGSSLTGNDSGSGGRA